MNTLNELENKLTALVLDTLESEDEQRRRAVQMSYIQQILQQAYDLGRKEALEELAFFEPKQYVEFMYCWKDLPGMLKGKILERSTTFKDIFDVEIKGKVVYSTDSLEDAKAWVRERISEYYGKENE